MPGPRVSAYPGSVTPEYSDDLIKDMNKLGEPERMKEVFKLVEEFIEQRKSMVAATKGAAKVEPDK